MSRILAIEADPTRQRLLTRLVGQYVHAELIVVNSVRDAIAAVSERVPDVVLAPTLLAPQDDAELMSAVKSLHAPHLQTLTMPALDMLSERPQETKRRLGLERRTHDLGLLYDPQLVAAQIIDGLERARLIRLEHEAAIEHARWLAERGGASSTATAARPDPSHASDRSADERRRAPRIARADASWVSGIRMPWGLDLDLINISSSGLLVESTSKLSAGVTYELQLDGPSGTLVVKARFIRSEVWRVDGRGVRYHSAAAFERQLDVAAGRAAAAPVASAQQALADLLAMVIAESDPQLEPADVRFARGLRQLVRARDVLVRRAPIVPADGSESFYFHVTGEDRARTILQVLFDPDRALTSTEFSLLKAAASLTAAVIELDRSRQSALLSAPSMAGVA
jgi:CheY-like chemotaxis protein